MGSKYLRHCFTTVVFISAYSSVQAQSFKDRKVKARKTLDKRWERFELNSIAPKQSPWFSNGSKEAEFLGEYELVSADLYGEDRSEIYLVHNDGRQ